MSLRPTYPTYTMQADSTYAVSSVRDALQHGRHTADLIEKPVPIIVAGALKGLAREILAGASAAALAAGRVTVVGEDVQAALRANESLAEAFPGIVHVAEPPLPGGKRKPEANGNGHKKNKKEKVRAAPVETEA